MTLSEHAAVPTVAIMSPLALGHSAAACTPILTASGGLTADERGVESRAGDEQDAGSYTMDYVRFNAVENGGSWWGWRTLPGAAGTFVSDSTATGGWFEVANPGDPVDLPSMTRFSAS